MCTDNFSHTVESGSGEDTTTTTANKREKGGLSDGVLSGMAILGLTATLMGMAVVFLVIYIRYGTIRKSQTQERVALISDNK